MASGWLRHLSGTFAFHASPESFLSSMTASQQQSPIHTRLLNRNVAIITSYRQIQAILGSTETKAAESADDDLPYSASQAYAVFMEPFSPGPNLLLSDGPYHAQKREEWDHIMQRVHSTRVEQVVKQLVKDHFTALIGSNIDLYSTMKQLAAKILLSIFLDLESTDPLFSEIVTLQENLLRGQFSMFPVSVDVGLWRSPRKVGLNAMRRLQTLVTDELRLAPEASDTCPFFAAQDSTWTNDPKLSDIANHVMLFTSSLAVKGLASLMSALLLNTFVLQEDGKSLAVELAELDALTRGPRLHSIQLETERLSPPIIGIMRHVSTDQAIPSSEMEGEFAHISRGSDAWLYFVRAGRDKAVFGADAETFRSYRFLGDHGSDLDAFSFSTGPKSCLGRDLSRGVCFATLETLLELGLELQGEVEDRGVLAWLGRCENVQPADWERGMRQLPVQHPREPVMVHVNRTGL